MSLDSTYGVAFDAAYVASKKPSIQALFAGTMGLPGTVLSSVDRYNLAFALAKSGEIIDVVIDAQGGDPYITMVLRQNYDYTRVPSALQPPVLLPPGLSFPGLPSYNPVGMDILVSTDLKDYPPYGMPAVPLPTAVSYVGAFLFGDWWIPTMDAQKKFKDGDTWAEKGYSWTFVVRSDGAFGNEYFWQRDAPL